MRCFIASAFGHDDVDTVYDQCVIPVLQKLGLTPLRVDRIEHNENIDKKIFELLDSSDIAIADITYARPSVYYEAGYAAGKELPVIYIVRGDHFRTRDDDPYGHFRVHFDLQMKNIIPWKDPDQAFLKKLEARLKVVLNPVIQKKEEKHQSENAREEFISLSLQERLALVQTTCIKHFKNLSFANPEKSPSPYTADLFTHCTFLSRSGKKNFQALGIYSTQSVLQKFAFYLSGDPFFYAASKSGQVEFIETHYIVASLTSVPGSRLAQSFSSMRVLKRNTYFREIHETNGYPSRSLFIHIIPKILSKEELLGSLRSITDEFGLANLPN